MTMGLVGWKLEIAWLAPPADGVVVAVAGA
jgi:hypothetical protein